MTLSQNSYLLRNFPAIDLHFLSKYAVFYNNLSKMLFAKMQIRIMLKTKINCLSV